MSELFSPTWCRRGSGPQTALSDVELSTERHTLVTALARTSPQQCIGTGLGDDGIIEPLLPAQLQSPELVAFRRAEIKLGQHGDQQCTQFLRTFVAARPAFSHVRLNGHCFIGLGLLWY